MPAITRKAPSRISKGSKPDEAVWVVQCEDAKYRVRLVPDLAAKVERIDQ